MHITLECGIYLSDRQLQKYDALAYEAFITTTLYNHHKCLKLGVINRNVARFPVTDELNAFLGVTKSPKQGHWNRCRSDT